MTEVRAQAAGVGAQVARANAAPPAAEVHEHDLSPIDEALFAAFEGDFRYAEALPSIGDQRAVAYAARRFGVRPPEGMDSRSLSFSDVADRMSNDWSITNLYLAAEKFSGDRTRGEKVKRGLSVATKAAVFLPDLFLSAVSSGAGRLHMDRTAKGIEVASVLTTAALHKPFQRLNEAGPNQLFRQVRRFVLSRYGVEYNTDPSRVMAWLRASILGGAAESPYTSDETMQDLAADFWTGSQGFVIRGDIQQGKRPIGAGVPYMRHDLRNGMDIRQAARLFVQEESDARTAREEAARNYFLPKPSKRPAGGAREELALSSDRYQGLVTLSFDEQQRNLRECFYGISAAGDILDPLPYRALAESWAALVERSYMPHPEQARFIHLVEDEYTHASAYLTWYLPEAINTVRRGEAQIGVVRLIADMEHPAYSGRSFITNRDQQLVDALDQAAFDWFDQPFGPYSDKPAIRQAMREAYIAGRHRLASSSDPGLNVRRALRLVNVTPDRRTRGALCQAVNSILDQAAAVVQAAQQSRRRR